MRTVFVMLMLALVAASGCKKTPNGNSNSENNNTKAAIPVPIEAPKPGNLPDASFASCNSYYPLKPGSTVKYTLFYPTGLTGDVTVTIDQVDDNGQKVFVEKTHIIDKQTRGLEILQLTEKRFVCDGERLQIISEKTESQIKDDGSRVVFNYRDNLYLPTASDLTRKGFTWRQVFTQSFTRGNEMPASPPDAIVVNCEVMGEEELTLPVGRFKAVKVRKVINKGEVTEYYIKGLGLARRDASTGGRMELESFAHLTPTQ